LQHKRLYPVLNMSFRILWMNVARGGVMPPEVLIILLRLLYVDV
jgi:hypothetical protein